MGYPRHGHGMLDAEQHCMLAVSGQLSRIFILKSAIAACHTIVAVAVCLINQSETCFFSQPNSPDVIFFYAGFEVLIGFERTIQSTLNHITKTPTALPCVDNIEMKSILIDADGANDDFSDLKIKKLPGRNALLKNFYGDP
jgi:hypothetical protein